MPFLGSFAMKSNDHNVLEGYRAEIAKCVRCGSCSATCPSFLADRRESRSPRGRMALIEAVLNGLLGASELYRDRLATCTGCLACESQCASGVPAATIIQKAKEAAFAEKGPDLIGRALRLPLRHPSLMASLAWLAPAALRYTGEAVKGRRTADAGTRGRGDAERTPTRGRIVFFPGCAVRHFRRDVGHAARRVLERLGYEVVVPDGLVCCGRPFLSLGDRDAAQEHALRNTGILAAAGADAVVTACASCGLTFKRDYPALLAAGREPVPVLDVHELLSGRIGELGIAPEARRVTWHDPCHLGRGQGLGRTAREVLLAVPGLRLTEMREPGRCCGFGGVMRATHPAHSMAIGEAKARDIMASGAPVVVTGCPGCMMQLTDALRRASSDAEVRHTVQVLAEALPDGGARAQREDAGLAAQGAAGRK
jgi:glycolate dehydrogenase iron-sulfur subunit